MKAILTFAVTAAVAALAQPAMAASILPTSYQVTVSEGLTNGNSFDVSNGNPFATPSAFSNTASASFTYTGALNFNNTAAQSGVNGDKNSAFGFSNDNISNYRGSGSVSYFFTPIADFSGTGTTGENNFLDSSASGTKNNNYLYGSYFTFDLGTLLAGTVLTITHDDGIALFQGSTRVGSSASGATGAVTDVITLGSTGATTLRYSRQNSTPSILQVSATGPVPEAATWAMMLGGFGLVGASLRGARRRATSLA